MGSLCGNIFSLCQSGEVMVEKEDKYDPTAHLSHDNLTVDNPTTPTVILISQRQKKSKGASWENYKLMSSV